MIKRLFNQTMAGYYLYVALGAIVPLLPPRLGYAVFGAIGGLFYNLFADAREPLRENLQHVMKGADATQIDTAARTALGNHLKNYYDFFRSTRLTADQIKSIVKTHGLENLERARQRGKGTIFVTAHFGNLDIVGQTFTLLGYRVTTPAEHVKPEILFRRIVQVRAAKGLRIIPVDGPLLALVRALKKNELIGLVSDLDVTKTGIIVDFFGEPARLPDGYAELALRTGASILPAFSLRCKDNSFEAFAEPPIELESTGNHDTDIRRGVERVVRVIEKWLSAHPEQWVMFHRIWQNG